MYLVPCCWRSSKGIAECRDTTPSGLYERAHTHTYIHTHTHTHTHTQTIVFVFGAVAVKGSLPNGSEPEKGSPRMREEENH